ncbi:MAG TPA: hypothetical protein VK993_13110 [Chthoniobacterales bacterium]|nr:hypothetical protein [Chthoniobacterales bacterium]
MTSRRWAAGLLLISVALLGYELLLMRLLALAYWGHFAGMVISTAMLGIASSGLFLFYARDRVERNAGGVFAVSAGLFGMAAPLAFLASQRLPFTPFLLTWSAREYAYLGGRSFLFFLAFFFAGVAIGTPFTARVLPMGRLYFWNMLGSGLAALPLLLAMNFAHPMRLLVCVAAVGIGAAVVGTRRAWQRLGWILAGLGVAAVVMLAPFRYSEYKDLSRTLLLPDARLIEERHGWDGIVQVVESPHTRYLPGLSLNFAGSLPPSQLVFTDAGAMTLVLNATEALAQPDFLRMTPETFSFTLMKPQSLLHLYGGTADLLRAHAAGVPAITIVDDSQTRVAAVRELFQRLSPVPLADRFVRADARQLLEQTTGQFDVIAVSLLGGHGTSTAGAASLDPSFLLTIDGFSRLFQRLTPGGHAVLSTWVENPARSGVRLISLWIETLRRNGVAQPSQHLIAMRSWSTLSIFVAREPFGPAAIDALRKFAEENSYDLVWFEGITPEETNQNNVIPEDPYYTAFATLLSPDSGNFIENSPFALTAPDTNRPFFNQYFRWAAVPQWVSTMGMGWLPFVEWGYILHVATLVVVTLLGVVLLIVPCVATRARPSLRAATLFLALGLAYMFVQMWAIYKLTQFVAHPLLAAALVLSAMLAASGAGAVFLTREERRRPALTVAIVCAALFAAALLFPLLMRLFYPQAIGVRVTLALFWLALPAFFMGFPFPYSLSRLTRQTDIPWALALNGFGSVLGSLLATLVAVHFGLLTLAAAAIALYAVVALLTLRQVDVQR